MIEHERVLLFAPHPDDESIAAGGLLQRLAEQGSAVQVVYVTDGENNRWAHRALLRQWWIGDAERRAYAALRRGEALRALRLLGIAPEMTAFLHLPDEGVDDRLETLIGESRRLIDAFEPTLIIAPSPDDLHPDHAAVARAVAAAHDRIRCIAYVVHGRTPAAPLVTIRLSAVEQMRKRAAIAAHRSQMVLGGGGRYLRHAAEYETFFDAAPARSHPPRLRTVRFWWSHVAVSS